MITALDTNVLIDVLSANSGLRAPSAARLIEARAEGALVICELVIAELASLFPMSGALEDFLRETDIELVDSGTEVLWRSGIAWRTYTRRRPAGTICARCGMKNELHCSRCGESIRYRQHVIADFIIGAHAIAHADQLLTRDRGYYQAYFPDLQLA